MPTKTTAEKIFDVHLGVHDDLIPFVLFISLKPSIRIPHVSVDWSTHEGFRQVLQKYKDLQFYQFVKNTQLHIAHSFASTTYKARRFDLFRDTSIWPIATIGEVRRNRPTLHFTLEIYWSRILKKLKPQMIHWIKLLDIPKSRATHAVFHILIDIPIITPRNILRSSMKLVLFLPWDTHRWQGKQRWASNRL